MKQLLLLVTLLLACVSASAQHHHVDFKFPEWSMPQSGQQGGYPAYRFRKLNSEPATCTTGDVYFNIGTAKNRQCLTTNTWSDFGSGSGSGTVTGTGTTNTIPKWTSASALGNSLITETSGRNNIPALSGGEFDAAFAGESGWQLSATQITDASYTPNQLLAVLENADSGASNSVSGAVIGTYDKRSSGEYGSQVSLNLDTIKTGNANALLMNGLGLYVWNQSGGTIGNIWGINSSIESDAGHITGDAAAIRIASNFLGTSTVDGRSIGLLINNQNTTPATGGTYAIYYDATENLFAIKDNGLIQVGATITPSGTTGAQTINKSAGSVNVAAAASSLVVTNSLVTANSIVMCNVATNDTTLKSVQCVPTSGSFTIFGNAAATAESRVNFWVLNQ